MAVYEREIHVDASLDDVWTFHSTTDGLVALTPEWLGLTVEAVTGPAGDPDPPELVEGTTIELSLRPFGVGPSTRTTSLVEHRRRDGDDAAQFRDRMVDGPFRKWVHTHSFRASDGGTVVTDRVEYVLPGGAPGRLVAPAIVAGLAPMFRHRHRRTRELLED